MLLPYAFAWDVNDLKDETLSPISTSANNVLIYGGGLTLTVLILEDAIVDPTQEEFVDHKPLGDLSKIARLGGEFIPNAAYILSQSISGAYGDKNGFNRALGMLKASAYASSVATVLKYTVREPRPIHRTERDSFPSGHTTSAFTFAGYIYEEHGIQWGVPALSLATLVGASRINDNRHYLHDVLFGATIGLAYGLGVSKIDKVRRQREQKKSQFSVAPIIGQQLKGLVYIQEF